ncbi:hybrid sensor histidine kinase/response regulator [Hydrogenophaga crocea]|uniref:histidine kinase n=1 Tax=Hydrogenophaga crocea TaxID=2716225 RepID=A0A6G8IG74_9BURK|nr:hybrid sensor histidine kinase/response regulator [Hydrogenophaga crocea]QIM52036.1 HAMP domain-containing histidine kinase [Hydrogenophaga crocea]
MRTDARAILFVDDEALSRKWFERCFSDEFEIASAASVDEALALLAARGDDFAVLITDYRMPGQDGMKLLARARRDYRHLVRMLVTAYAEKDVAMAAINQGHVLRILEKPLEDALTREALREALALFRSTAVERALNESRAAGLRETLGFLAHELNTPLTTVRGSVGAVIERLRPAQPGDLPGTVRFEEGQPGEVLSALQRAERRALYCQSLVSTFVQSARDAHPGAQPQTVSASGLIGALLDEYPFDDTERQWVHTRVQRDFRLPGRRDLLYLVLCTLAKNALQALRGRLAPELCIEAGCEDGPLGPHAWIRFTDNGPGIAPEVLSRLTREPVTTRAASGGNGMGLMFCQRVMQAAGGTVRVASTEGQGTRVELGFERNVMPAAPGSA